MLEKANKRYFTSALDITLANILIGFCRLLFVFNIGCLLPGCLGTTECPSDPPVLRNEAFACFNNYSTQKMNLDKSQRRLFSGIDVETLRAYCSSYIQGLRCTRDLLNMCGESKKAQIEKALVNLKGMERELADLCRTSRLYEIYAQYMTCYADRGPKSDWCYKDKMLKGVESINMLTQEDLCSRLQETEECIENNIRYCGPQATELVHLLTKPMVRRSGQCVRHLEQPPPKQTTEGKSGTKKPSDPGKRNVSHSTSNGDPNASSTLHKHSNLILILLLQITYLTYLHKLKSDS